MLTRSRRVLIPLALAPLVACAAAVRGAASPSPPAAIAREPPPIAPVRPLVPVESPRESDAGADGGDELPEVAMTFGLRIPMRDGVTLSATIYRPAHLATPLPVVFSVTPYTTDDSHKWALHLAQHGYVGASVDIRGRGNSGGEFDPWHPHPGDMRDVVEWFATQPWCDGNVAMWGGSYRGATQWWTAREMPPHLRTIIPIAAVSFGVDFPMTDNVPMAYVAQWLTDVAGRTANDQVFADDAMWRNAFIDAYVEKRAFRSLDSYVGSPSRAFQEALAHPSFDAFWRSSKPTPEQYRAMRLPILSITGHYDGDQAGALSYYRDHMRYGAPDVTAEHYLVIGPWDHHGTRFPSRVMGGVKFGESSVVDVEALSRDWYAWRIKGAPRPAFLKDRVAYYVPGEHAETWRYAPTLDGVTKERARLFLASSGSSANDLFHSGTLARVASPSAPDRYVFDPSDVTPGKAERNDGDDEAWLTTQSGLTDGTEPWLFYHSDPLPDDLELAGDVRLEAWLAMDVPDTDVSAALYEIKPNGTSVYLTGALMRARYRESREKEALVKPGAILRYDFTTFPWFARRLAKGSRIRLVVGPSNTPFFEKNYGSGGVVADETGKAARVAHVALLHDAEHASVLELPIAR